MVGKGSILISEPYLGDPNFERTVLLICEHTDEGSLGFVLNKPSVITVESVIPDLEDFSDVLYLGGPVGQDSVNFIYKGNGEIENSLPIGNGFFLGGEFEQLLEMVNLKQLSPADFRFFSGYSGWSPGQLQKEMEENTWITGNLSIEQVFQIEPQKMWQEILKSMGGKYRMYSNFPIDPRLN
jgi:putative transcriptional regulator